MSQRKINKSLNFFIESVSGNPIDGFSGNNAIVTNWVDLSAFNGAWVAYLGANLTGGNPRFTIEVVDEDEDADSIRPLAASVTLANLPEIITKEDFVYGKMRVQYFPNGATGTITFKYQLVE